jgi:hypothetical protein
LQRRGQRCEVVRILTTQQIFYPEGRENCYRGQRDLVRISEQRGAPMDRERLSA